MVLPGVRCACRLCWSSRGRGRRRRFPSLSPSRGDSRVMCARPSSRSWNGRRASRPLSRLAATRCVPPAKESAVRSSPGPSHRMLRTPVVALLLTLGALLAAPVGASAAPPGAHGRGIRRRRAGARREVRAGGAAGRAEGGLRAGRAVRAHRRRQPAGQRHGRAARALDHRRHGEDRPHRRRPRRGPVRLPPRLPGHPAQPGVLLRGVGQRADRRLGRHDLRPGRDRARVARAWPCSTGSTTRSTTSTTSTRATGR